MSDALTDCLAPAIGHPDLEFEFERFLCATDLDGEDNQAGKAGGPFLHDPQSCCVLACGPWPSIVAAQLAAHRRGFLFHKEVFDM